MKIKTPRNASEIHLLRRKLYFTEHGDAETIVPSKMADLGFKVTYPEKNIAQEDGRQVVRLGLPVFSINGEVIDDATSFMDLVEHHFHNIIMKI